MFDTPGYPEISDHAPNYFAFWPTRQQKTKETSGSYLLISGSICSANVLLKECYWKKYNIIGYRTHIKEKKQTMLVYQSVDHSQRPYLHSNIHQVNINELDSFIESMNSQRQTIQCFYAPEQKSWQKSDFKTYVVTQQHPLLTDFKAAQIKKIDAWSLDNALAELKHQKLCSTAGLALSSGFLFVVLEL